jgi:ABC-type phosphate transport system substrate-binding protein
MRIRLFSAFKHRRQNILYMLVCMAAWSVIGTVLIPWPTPVYATGTTVVPYSLNKQDTPFTRDELREIFFGRQTLWRDGSPLRVFVLPDQHPLHVRFSKEVLGVYPYQLRSAWDRMIYSGTGTPPATVDSLKQMETLIKETPGAIGYIEK